MRRVCFFIAPIDSPGTPVRMRSDQILDILVRPALERLGYDVLRLDQLATGGSLSAQARSLARHADLVVADLTGGNANVFYELGFRHAFNKPCVHIIETGAQIPFDVADLRTCFVNSSCASSIESAREELAHQAVAALALGRGPVSCPSEHELAAFLIQPLTVPELSHPISVTISDTASIADNAPAVATVPDRGGASHAEPDADKSKDTPKLPGAAILRRRWAFAAAAIAA